MLSDVETLSRVILGILLVGVVCVGLPHRIRAERAGGHVSARVDPSWFWRVMAFVGPLMAVACLMFLIWPRWIDFSAMALPRWLRLCGGVFGVAGVFLFGWMFRHLGLNVTSTSMPRAQATLVTSGPYRWMRHPMYSAALLLATAAALLTANWIVLVGGIAMFALLAARSRIEEERLIEKFGEAYRDYQRRTGRFVPRLTRAETSTSSARAPS